MKEVSGKRSLPAGIRRFRREISCRDANWKQPESDGPKILFWKGVVKEESEGQEAKNFALAFMDDGKEWGF